MKYIQHFFTAALMVLISTVFAAAQTESDLKSYFEGRRVEVKIDMPATKDGIDVYPNRRQPIDYSKYSNLIKTYGVGVEEGDRIMITKIKVKEKHIEFQLGGGGYGTFGDDTSTSVYVPSADKTRREKYLEKEIKYESDDRRRRRMREELDYLRNERRREDSRNRAEVAAAEELAKQRIQEKRTQGGSRFNIRFDEKLTYQDLTPQVIMNALAEYIDFSELRGR